MHMYTYKIDKKYHFEKTNVILPENHCTLAIYTIKSLEYYGICKQVS